MPYCFLWRSAGLQGFRRRRCLIFSLPFAWLTVLLLASGASTAAQPESPITWQAPIGQDHPLTGRIWEVASGRFLDESELLDRLTATPYVITGESHNNPDHHQLQLRILRRMLAGGRRVALGLEIFSSDDQPALDGMAAEAQPDANRLFDRLGWGRRYRSMWQQYRPLVQFAAEAGVPLVAMALSRKEVAAIRNRGIEALPAQSVTRFRLDQPLPSAQQELLVKDLLKAHCGMLFSRDLDSLLLVQRSRDVTMAGRLTETDADGGMLLLAGLGHARGDRGVPYLLSDLRQRGELVNLLFASVQAGRENPADYREWFGGQGLPFDYVWFTPRVDDEDPCERLQRIYGGASSQQQAPAPYPSADESND